ncbi:MAG TPA: hypothetical protein VGC57_10635 [Cellulomonas sp.]
MTADTLADHLHDALLPGWPPRRDERLTDYARAIRQTLTADPDRGQSS